MTLKRAEAFFSGHVQGVGFRFNAKQVSRNYKVTGTVENLGDRRVKLVVEGNRGEVEKFLQEVRNTTHGRVADVEVQWYQFVGNFCDFRMVR
ncbi:MAG: acylphosphatase [Planctomycetota bacterium]